MADDPGQNGGQRLRWWQEEKAGIPPVGGVAIRTQTVEPQVAEIVPDIGQELEEEALRLSAAEARGERVVIYANPGQNNARLRKRMMYFALPLVAIYGLVPLLLHQPLLFIIWMFLILEYAFIYMWMRRVNEKQTRPVVTLTRAGLEIHTLGHDMGLIQWDEIKEIRAYNFLYRYVGIVPKDTNAVCRRLTTRQAALTRANYIFERLIYRPLRCFVAPINLAQQMMPMTADELVAKIATFRLENRV